MRNNSGEGVMSMHRIIEGVYLMFNDLHMENCDSKLQINSKVLCIDHCREGRIEHHLKNGIYSYLSAGDLRIDDRNSHYTDFNMPLAHYHGITIALFLDCAETSLQNAFPGFPVRLDDLFEKYCSTSDPFILRAVPQIEHIFSELYAVPQQIKDYYYRLKMFELMLYLDVINVSEHDQSGPYFYKTQVEKIKAIRQFITGNLDEHYTLEALSGRFDIPLTSMKKCFRGVYGTSIYSYIRSCRMNRAAVLLRTTDFSVARIAGEVGYSSPSKFAAAFRDIMKKNPLDYRNSVV